MCLAAASDAAPREPRRAVAWFPVLQVSALIAAIAEASATAGASRWSAGALVTVGAFTIVSELYAVRASGSVYVSGSFLGIVLTAVACGGTPAAALGMVTVCVGWLTTRERPIRFCTNLANYAWFPLLTGLAFHAAVSVAGASPRHPAFYLLVLVAFVFALGVNFTGVVGSQCLLDRTRLRDRVRAVLVPVLAAELFSAVLTIGGVYVYERLGAVGLALSGVVFVIFQYLAGELLTSQRRSVALRRAATTDSLTGLYNRDCFGEIVNGLLRDARVSASPLVLMLMDLDHFKEINDTLGHQYGDAVLRDLGPRLADAVGADGVVARLGGDEFGILLDPGDDVAGAVAGTLQRLFAQLEEPFTIDEMSLDLGASVGVAHFPADGDDVHALLRCADIAMYAAKVSQTDVQVYAAERNHHSRRRLSVTTDMRHALASDQIVVHFQPIVDLEDLAVRGAEGLVRWQHPHHGLILPNEFVQTVEQTGLIGPLTRHVVERAVAECAGWRRAGHDLTVSVNLSVRNLLDRELPRQIADLLSAHGLPPDSLQLEITESMIMSDPERALATVRRLSDLGVRLSVDDFGTGYSSLANLRHMPIDELKIDRSFVSPMLRDESDLIIVRSTINLGHDLGLQIIAEGVEDRPTLERLATLGCDLAQGYHLSRPMPPDAFAPWLAQTVQDAGAGAADGGAAPLPAGRR